MSWSEVLLLFGLLLFVCLLCCCNAVIEEDLYRGGGGIQLGSGSSPGEGRQVEQEDRPGGGSPAIELGRGSTGSEVQGRGSHA